MFQFSLPTKIYSGEGVLDQMPELIAAYGDNALLVTASELTDHADRVESLLTSCRVAVTRFLLDLSEPSCEFIDASAAELKRASFSCIIGLGGGSAIDMAKALAIALVNPEPIWMYANLSNRPPVPMERPPLPVIAIPTTSGTGSEVTPYAVLTNEETKQKGTIQEPSIFPTVALVDPSLSGSMPAPLTATTGVDAFAHAFESCINISKESPVSEWAGAEAMQLIFENLLVAYCQPENMEARSNMAWASTLAGIAIAHRGTTTPHAIAEPLGALTKLPHGLAVTITILPVLRESWPHMIEKLAVLNERVFAERASTPKAAAEGFIQRVEELVAGVELNRPLQGFQSVKDGFAQQLLENVLTYKFRPLKQHPAEFDQVQLFDIIREILHG